MLKQWHKAIRRCILSPASVIKKILRGEASIGAQIARRGSRFDSKTSLDVRARQITTKVRFDFDIEKSLFLRLSKVVKCCSDCSVNHEFVLMALASLSL